MSATNQDDFTSASVLPLPTYGTYSHGALQVIVGSVIQARFKEYRTEYIMIADHSNSPPQLRVPRTRLPRLVAVKVHPHGNPAGYLGLGKTATTLPAAESFFTEEKTYYFAVLCTKWTGARSSLVYTGDLMPGSAHTPGPGANIAFLGLPVLATGMEYFWMPRSWLEKEEIDSVLPKADQGALKELISREMLYELRRAMKRMDI